MKTLHLNLKKKWYDMYLSGVKKEEYREITSFWYGRLVDRDNLRSIKKASLAFIVGMAKYEDTPEPFWIKSNEIFKNCFKKFDTITFSNGYSKNRPQFVIEFKGIEIKQGNPQWGAEKDKYYFVLKTGKILLNQNPT